MGKCKVNDKWFKCTDKNGYLIGSWAKKSSDTSLFCMVCQSDFNVDHGFSRVDQHAETKTHKNNCKTKLHPLQLKLEKVDSACHENEVSSSGETQTASTDLSSGQQIKTVSHGQMKLAFSSYKEKAMKMELMWTVKSVLCHYSLNSCSDIAEIFREMFGNSVPDDFTLSPSKMMYLITEALGPYFWEQITDDARSSAYTLCYDETTNEANKKEMQIAIRYWSSIKGEVVENHLQTFFMGHALAKDLHQNLISAGEKANLPFSNLLMVSCDGPNVNKAVLKLMNQSVLAVRSKPLIDIGTCSLHKIHNSFLHGLEKFGYDVVNLIIEIFHYFDGWPARWEDFQLCQEKVGSPKHRFLKHVTSRWLTVSPAAKRILEQWCAINRYFLTDLPAKSTKLSEKSKEIIKLIKQPDIKAQLLFVTESATIFSSYLQFFQKEGPLVHLLYDYANELLIKLRNKVYQSDTVCNFSVVEENFLPVNNISCSEVLIKELKNMKERDVGYFRTGMKWHFVESAKYLSESLKLNEASHHDSVLYNASCLKVGEFKSISSEPKIVALGNALPFDVDVAILLDEWKLLKFESEIPEGVQTIDKYWSYVFNLRSVSNCLKYPTVNKVVKAILCLSHGSASIERGFSLSGHVLTSDKVNMSERGLNARLNILSGMKLYKHQAHLLPITNKLLVLARNANQSYKNYLEEKHMKEQMLKETEERRSLEKKAEKLKKEAAADLNKLSNDLLQKTKEMEVQGKAADQLVKAATKRLENGIKRKDYEEIILAQGMLAGVKRIRSAEAEKSDQVSTIAKDIKRKTTKISSYFKKK